MRAVGGPEVLAVTEVQRPEPAGGQVLVRTEAIAVSEGEMKLRSGVYPFPVPLPAVFGVEVAGVVEAVGEGVDPGLVGRLVTAVTGGAGAYAEYVAVDLVMATVVPDGLDAVDAVASAAPGAVATALLAKAGLRGGETVLVEGGSGKVGGYLVRHAREAGARVIATASDPSRDLGADVVVDHTDPEWPAGLSGVDVAFEMVGGRTAAGVLDAMAPGGLLLLYGTLGGESPVIDGGTVLRKGIRVIGCSGPVWFAETLGTRSPEFLAAAAEGRTHKQPVGAVLSLADAVEAHRRVEAGGTGGRIVLVP